MLARVLGAMWSPERPKPFLLAHPQPCPPRRLQSALWPLPRSQRVLRLLMLEVHQRRAGLVCLRSLSLHLRRSHSRSLFPKRNLHLKLQHPLQSPSHL